jgi:hypothetical protein
MQINGKKASKFEKLLVESLNQTRTDDLFASTSVPVSEISLKQLKIFLRLHTIFVHETSLRGFFPLSNIGGGGQKVESFCEMKIITFSTFDHFDVVFRSEFPELSCIEIGNW